MIYDLKENSEINLSFEEHFHAIHIQFIGIQHQRSLMSILVREVICSTYWSEYFISFCHFLNFIEEKFFFKKK